MQKCNQCGEEKKISEFYKHKNKANGHQSYCKKCTYENAEQWVKNNLERNRKTKKDWYKINSKRLLLKRIKQEYGLSEQEYNGLIEKQKNKCAVCGTSDVKMNHCKRLVIDHCHKTGKVRGLLCNHCNTALAAVNDNVDTLKKLIKYVKKTNK